MPVTVRPVRPDDAAGVLALLAHVVAEPVNNLMREPGEPMFTEEQEREFLASQIMRPDWRGFVAVAESGEIIGMVMIDGKQRPAVRHRGELGINVAASWRGQGVGRALMERAIAWARESGVLTRIELIVLARNETAIRLYERLGFQHEGRRQRAMLRNGEYLDDLMMSLLL
ncbi:MAG TPA: GNAT family protein [Ktedonobacterales bacterium]|nr:GNAT family protein [Ktedonobacterales bacterium]